MVSHEEAERTRLQELIDAEIAKIEAIDAKENEAVMEFDIVKEEKQSAIDELRVNIAEARKTAEEDITRQREIELE
jgi:hypothetical protein